MAVLIWSLAVISWAFDYHMVFKHMSTSRAFIYSSEAACKLLLEGDFLRNRFAYRFQHSLKLYTGFLDPVNRKFLFCLPAVCTDCFGSIFRLNPWFSVRWRCSEDADWDQSSHKFYTGFLVPVKNKLKIVFSSGPVGCSLPPVKEAPQEVGRKV